MQNTFLNHSPSTSSIAMKPYYSIYDILIPLDRCLNNGEDLNWWEWRDAHNALLMLGANGQMPELHDAMQTYYKKFLYGDDALYHICNREALDLIACVIDADELFANMVADIDMVALTNVWICNGTPANFMYLLRKLTTVDYEGNWEQMFDDVNQKLLQLEVSADSASAEFYCLLHGFLMIMNGSKNYLERQTRFELFRSHWKFLRHLYSMMVRRIVGMNFPNFAGVINNARNTIEYIPYLKVLYSALIDRYDDLCKLGTKQKSLDKAIEKLADVMNSNQQSDELDELCEMLFPEEIREMLNTHRLPTYKELGYENRKLREAQLELRKQMEEQTRQTNEEIAKLTGLLKTAVETSIPVEYITSQLMDLPVDTAWGIFQKLNELLQENETWRKYDIGIRNMLKDKIHQQELSQNRINMINPHFEGPLYGISNNETVNLGALANGK